MILTLSLLWFDRPLLKSTHNIGLYMYIHVNCRQCLDREPAVVFNMQLFVYLTNTKIASSPLKTEITPVSNLAYLLLTMIDDFSE